MSMKAIEQQWQGFAAMVFHGQSPTATQQAEMKKAFFAGAWALFSGLEEIGESHVTEDQGEAWLEARRAECLAFKNRLMAEYAERN